MLYLKKINYEDVDEEYKAIKSMPAQEKTLRKWHENSNLILKNSII